MTYEEKLDYLNRYRFALARVRELTEDIAVLQAMAERTTPHLTGMPVARFHDKFTAIEDRKEAKEHELARMSKRLSVLRVQTIRAIRTAPFSCRRVLFLVYIQNWEIGDIAALLRKSARQVYRLHRQGVSSIH